MKTQERYRIKYATIQPDSPPGITFSIFNFQLSTFNSKRTTWNTPYKFSGKELDNETGYSYFGARYYDPNISIWLSLDPLSDKYPNQMPYSYVGGNPIMIVDPNGMEQDWVESAGGQIYWDKNATSQKTTKAGEKYLGKNVLVGTHDRDVNLYEPINSATFELYLESNKEGPSATICGNTVPADITKYGTVAEGLFPAEYAIYKGDGALLINGGKDLPTVLGNPNNKRNFNTDGTLKPIEQHIIDEVFFHKGNYARESLSTNMVRRGERVEISEGCQTGGCGPGSLELYRAFIKKTEGFKGSYYLRSNPNQ